MLGTTWSPLVEGVVERDAEDGHRDVPVRADHDVFGLGVPWMTPAAWAASSARNLC